MSFSDTKRMVFDVSAKDNNASKTFDKIGTSAEDAGAKGESAFSKMGGMVGGAVAGAGLALGALFSKALDFSAGNAKMSAQLGLTEKQSASAGKVAGSLYAHNYGTGMEQINEAITSVVRNIDGMRGASSKTLSDVSGMALNTANIFDQDLGGVTKAVSQLMRTGLAKNAKEAFDIITVGFQHGADKSEDFLDTLNEYGTQFRKLGINGKQATGLITQGLKAGARDGDLVADAIKEFSIRAVDGSKTTSQGFKQLGLDGKKMADDIAAGGPRARKGLDTVLDRLRAIKDPVKQSRVAVELFGTQAEDLGDALYALDPSKAVDGLGKVAGASDRANKAFNDTPSATMQEFFRTLQQGAINVIGGSVVPKLQALGGWIQKNEAWLKPLIVVAGSMLGIYKAWTLAQAALNLVMAANPLGIFVLALAGMVVGLVYAWKHSETFRNVVQGALEAVGKAANHVWNDVLKPVFHFIVSSFLNVASAIINGAAKAFGWVPGLGGKLRTAAAKFDEFRDDVNNKLDGIKPAKIKVEDGDARDKVNSFRRFFREQMGLVRQNANVHIGVSGGGVGDMLNQPYQKPGKHGAVGGRFPAFTPLTLGENGTERVVPDHDVMVVPDSRARGATGSGGDTFVINVDGGLDSADAIWRRIEAGLRQLKKSRGWQPLTFEQARA